MSKHPIKNQKDIDLPLVSRDSNFQKDMQLLGLLSKKSSQHKDMFSNFPISTMALPRNDSVGNHGNIFTGFGQEEQPKQTPKLSLAQSYALQCLEYEKYLYNNQIKLIIRRMAIRAYNVFRAQKNSQFFTFPIQKLLGIIAKKLLLNRFQLLFLQYAFVQTKWHYDIDCIKKHVNHFNSFVLIQDSEMPTQAHKYMQIYLLYCAYYSKKSLNQLPPDNIFHQFLIGVCPKFKEFFPQWTQKSNVANKINPKALNNIFKRLTFYSDRDHEEEQNYSLIVQEIIDISPSYNADKNAKKKKNESKKKKKEQKIEEYDQMQMQNNESREDYNHRLPRYQHDFEMDELPILKAKKSSFISNVDALEPRHYLTRSLSNE